MHRILLFYKYAEVKEPEKLAAFLRGLCLGLGLKGRVIVADEGVNATLEGTTEHVESFIEAVTTDYSFKKIFKKVDWKMSVGTGSAFPRLSVKLRPEIVTSNLPGIDPTKKTGTYINPTELDRLYKGGEDFAVVDMRNNDEYEVGHFRNSINPGLTHFRDLPDALPKLQGLKNKKVVTVCTGGVRCEKASAYLLENGFQEVYQLAGGMQRYLEKFPQGDFEGRLYVFDEREVI